jgi:hypothetical protein
MALDLIASFVRGLAIGFAIAAAIGPIGLLGLAVMGASLAA